MDQETARDFRISYPKSGFAITAENVYVMGAADPRYPVLLEGEPVQRTINGYFNLYLPLEVGENQFTFTYRGEEYPYTINRRAPANGGGSQTQEPGGNLV